MSSASKLFPPFRAEQIGSLKRPRALLNKRAEFDDGKCSKEELAVLEDKAITGIVNMQREAGIKAMTDGEFRRYVRSTPAQVIHFRAQLICRTLR